MTQDSTPAGLKPAEAEAYVVFDAGTANDFDETAVRDALDELAERRRLGIGYAFRHAAAALGAGRAYDDRERLAMTPETRAEAVRQLLDDALEDARNPPADSSFKGAVMAAQRVRSYADALATLEGLVPRLATNTPPDPLEPVADVAARLVGAVSEAGIQREHFTGRLEVLADRLDELELALRTAGR